MAAASIQGLSRRQGGMTMIEQIMALSIAAVLMVMATPPLHRLLRRDELGAAQTDFIAVLRHARGTAVISGKRTLLCPSLDGSECEKSTRWDNGWLLGHDSDNDHQPDGNPLRIGQGYPAKVIVRSSVGRSYVRFAPNGSAAGSNITLVLCEAGSHDPALSVVVSNSGRIRGAKASAAQTESCLRAAVPSVT